MTKILKLKQKRNTNKVIFLSLRRKQEANYIQKNQDFGVRRKDGKSSFQMYDEND
jgi:hypothetical protein